MAFVRSETRHRGKASMSAAARWGAVAAAGFGVASASLAGLAGLVFLATSFTSTGDFSGRAATPERLAFATTLYSKAQRQDCAEGCEQRAQYIVQQAKSPRTKPGVDAQVLGPTATQRFDKARTVLTRDKLVAALAQSQKQIAAMLPVKDRFYPVANAASHPAPSISSRFGPQLAEAARSSRLAMALAGEGEIEIAYAPAVPTVGPSMPLTAMPETSEPVQTAELFESVPEDVPVPLARPKLTPAVAVAELQPAPASKPARRAATQPQALAYAAPDDDAPSVGQAFKNLFSSQTVGKGVAVYDISAQTVTLPNGQRMEAHSGIGHMADNPRYVDRKMNGPTPPNTYRLVMRESRFHGVEAIRMLPVDGKNKYGRDGILAHSYLLRGGRAESHGCVAFADYQRFLKLFKQGKITHMIVVPGRGKAGTRVASSGRGA